MWELLAVAAGALLAHTGSLCGAMRTKNRQTRQDDRAEPSRARLAAYTTAAVFSASGDGARPQPEHNTRRTIPLIAPRLPRCQRGRLLVRRFPTLAAQSVRPHR